ERGKIALHFSVVGDGIHQHGDAPNALGLLRVCRERPRSRTTDQRDELAPPHSITSSARARNDSGIVRPSAFAVLRLMIKSNRVDCSTGISPAFVPRRILSTKSADRLNRSGTFGP